MANSTLSGLANSLTGAVLAVGDLIEWTDVSDTSMGAGGTSKKMTAAELVKGLLGNSAILTQSLTGSAADSLINATATWNTTGTPSLIKANVTNTQSNAASLLVQLQIGGADQFRVFMNARSNSASTGAEIRLGPDSGGERGAISVTSYSMYFWVAGTQAAYLTDTARLHLASVALGANATSPDTYINRDAANTLALRNSTNAQEARVYGTFTDASNYRRLAIAMTTAGVASIAPAGAGSGASGNVLHISGLPTSNPGPGILWNNAGTPAIGT